MWMGNMHLYPARTSGNELTRVVDTPALRKTYLDWIVTTGKFVQSQLHYQISIERTQAMTRRNPLHQLWTGHGRQRGKWRRANEDRVFREIVQPYTARLTTQYDSSANLRSSPVYSCLVNVGKFVTLKYRNILWRLLLQYRQRHSVAQR